MDHLTRSDTASAGRLDALRVELERLDSELIRYADAVATAGPLETILHAIRVREERRATVESGNESDSVPPRSVYRPDRDQGDAEPISS